MCSTFLPRQNFNSAYSKSQYEAPKQLLQLRCQVKPLLSPALSESSDSAFSRSTYSPKSLPESQKLCLTYIEKDKRGLSSGTTQFKMRSSAQYQAFDRPNHHSRKTTQPPLMRTPSSGFSSSSSSENMFSGLCITTENDQQKVRDVMDPSIEVDLDMFLTPEARYKQPMPTPMSINATSSLAASGGNLSTICNSQNALSKPMHYLQQVKNPMPNPYADYSYANVKRSSGYTDYMPTNSVGSLPSMSSVPMSPGTWIRCQYCWETYVKLCQRVANQDPMVNCEGPWQWHSLYDSQGRVTCPRLWFTQLERAGSDMLAQMTLVRNAPV